MPSFLTCRAAICWEPKSKLSIETITVPPPQPHEVRVKVVATAICSTDYLAVSDRHPQARFPVILGHEAGGIVESIGANVNNMDVGDHVLLLYVPQCGACRTCMSKRTNLCERLRKTQTRGVMPDGNTRFRCDGRDIFHFNGISAFAEYTIVCKENVVKIRKDAPLQNICLLSCGVASGMGAVRKVCNVGCGETIGVFGLGAVGLGAVQGGRIVGAAEIIGVDFDEGRCDMARKLGATSVIRVKEDGDGVCGIREVVEGGVDYVVECVGKVEVMKEAVRACHEGWGVCCIVGMAGEGEQIQLGPEMFITGRQLTGCVYGGYEATDVSKLVDEYMEGEVKLDELISARYGLEEINEALEDVSRGKAIKGVLMFD